MRWLTNLLSDLKKLDPEIRNIFFNLIQNNKGSITVMDFAVAADLSGTEAKKILEKFAVEFDATFDVTEEGQVVYLFPTTSNPIAKEILSESKELKNSNKPQLEPESKKNQTSPFPSSNNDVQQQIANIKKKLKIQFPLLYMEIKMIIVD